MSEYDEPIICSRNELSRQMHLICELKKELSETNEALAACQAQGGGNFDDAYEMGMAEGYQRALSAIAKILAS